MEGPGPAAVGARRPAGGAEQLVRVVELAPGRDHPVGGGRVDGEGRLVGGVADDVAGVWADVDLHRSLDRDLGPGERRGDRGDGQ